MWKRLWNWAMGRDWKNFEEHDRKSLDCLQTVNRNMDVNDSASEDSEGSGEHGR